MGGENARMNVEQVWQRREGSGSFGWEGWELKRDAFRKLCTEKSRRRRVRNLDASDAGGDLASP